ncbi:MAG: hypothetical protein GXP30_15100 [Verrucomicrobia bacterium]|nr:hypothetical protein [Verrucomicrobiota bacterium]
MKFRGFMVAVVWLMICLSAEAQNIRKELPTNHAPADLLRPLLKKTLSPQGRFVVFATKGTVLVIDTADKVRAAELALATMDSPVPDVVLDFAINPGNKMPSSPRKISFSGFWRDFPYPTAYLAPRIPTAVGAGGNFVITPAHPTGFKRRKVGVVLETQATPNSDGSVTLDINHSSTEFAGFINYGSAIFGSGAQGVIPLNNAIANPGFFGPLINANTILMPIFDTTKFSTQIVVRPRVANNIVTVDMIPQLKVISNVEPGFEGKVFSLKQYQTRVLIQNGHVGAVDGFKGASPEFNRHFLGAKENAEGPTAIKIRARVRSGKKVD